MRVVTRKEAQARGLRGRSNAREFPTRDHMVPRSRMPAMRTVIVCSGCNNDKGNRTLSEWLDVLRDAGDPRAETVAAFIAENRELMEDELTLHWAEAAARCAPASIIAGVSA